MLSFFSSRDEEVEEEDDDVASETGDLSTLLEESSGAAAAAAATATTKTNDDDDDDAMTPVALAVSESSPQTPPKVPVPVPARRWTELHRETCLRQHNLLATAAQVQALTAGTHNHNDVDLALDLPNRTSVLLGNDPELQQKLIQQFLSHEQSFSTPRKQAAAASSNSSVWYTAAATTYAVAAVSVHVLTSPIRLVNRIALQQIEGDGYDDDDLSVGWEEEHNLAQESVHHNNGSIESVIDLHEFVFHVDLATECLRLLQKATTHSPNRILRLEASTSSFHNSHNNNKEQFSWHGWLQHVATTAAAQAQAHSHLSDAAVANLLLHLPESQTDLLLHCLVKANSDRFQIVRRPHASDVVVFGTNVKNDTDLQTQLTLHDLSYAVSQVQERIDVTEQLRDTSTQRALAAHRQGHGINQNSKNTKLAVAEMKRRRLYEQTLESSYATLEKLEQVRLTLETAVHQRNELYMLRQATEALKTIHLSTSLEQVDDVLDDFLEEQEHVTRVSDTLVSAMLPAVDGDGDDELMKELEALTLDDKDAKVKEEAKYDGSAGTPANEISKSEEEEETSKPEASNSPTPVAL